MTFRFHRVQARRGDEPPTKTRPRPKPSDAEWRCVVAVLAPFIRGENRSNTYDVVGRWLSMDRDIVEHTYARALDKYHAAGWCGLKRDTGLAEASSHRALFRELRVRFLISAGDLSGLPHPIPPGA